MNADKFHTVNREDYYHDLSSNEIVHEKDTTKASNGLDWIAIAAIAFIGISILLWQRRFRKNSGFSQTFKDSTQTKCTNCRFFDRTLDSSFNGAAVATTEGTEPPHG